MPRYLITHAKGQRGDMLIEDPDLTVEYAHGWAIFRDKPSFDRSSVVLALPAEQVASIERVDEEAEPTPQKD